MPRLQANNARSCAYDDTLVNSSGTILFNPGGLGKGAVVVVKAPAANLAGGKVTPTVGLSTTATDAIYGVVDHVDVPAGRVNVWIDGTAEVTKSSNSVVGDIGLGIFPDSTTAGQVTVGTAATTPGRGFVYDRVGDNSPTLYVDLSANPVVATNTT